MGTPLTAEHAVIHLRRAVLSARKISSKSLVSQCEVLLCLINTFRGDGAEANASQELWTTLNSQGLTAEQDRKVSLGRVRQIGELVKLVGSKVSTGWSGAD